MGRKRRCRYCREPYEPDPRTAKKQRACGQPDCQRARHADACLAWHAKNPDYDQDRRLRKRIVVEPPPSPDVDPRNGIRWRAVRDALSLEGTVVASELAGIVARWARDAMDAKVGRGTKESSRISGSLTICS